MTDKRLTPSQAANRLSRQGIQVSDRTIQRLCKRGDLKAIRLGTRYHIAQAEVDRLAKGN